MNERFFNSKKFIPKFNIEIPQDKMGGSLDFTNPLNLPYQNALCEALFGQRLHQIKHQSIRSGLIYSNENTDITSSAIQLNNPSIRQLTSNYFPEDYYNNPVFWGSRLYLGMSNYIVDDSWFNSKSDAEGNHVYHYPDAENTALACNDKTLVSFWADGFIAAIDTETRNPQAKLNFNISYNFAAANNNVFYITSHQNNFLGQLDLRNKKVAPLYNFGLGNLPITFTFSANNNTIAVSVGSSHKSFISLVDQRMAMKEILRYYEHQAVSKGLTFFDRNLIITGGGGRDKTLRVWDTNTGKTLYSKDTGNQIVGIHKMDNDHDFFVAEGWPDSKVSYWSYNKHWNTLSLKETNTKANLSKKHTLFSAQNPKNAKDLLTASADEIAFWEPAKKKKVENKESMFDKMTIR